MTKSKDDLEAVRTLVTALEGFDSNDQERILRWAREKLGLTSETSGASPPLLHPPQQQPPVGHSHGKPKTDIKTFVDTKNPKSDMHFAVTIAYYYRFEAQENQRKEEITAADLREACRQVGRKRLKDPGQTLRNAHSRGLFNKSELGVYSINTVGENLVATALPVSSSGKTTSHTGSHKSNKTKALSRKKDSQKQRRAKTSKQLAKKFSQ